MKTMRSAACHLSTLLAVVGSCGFLGSAVIYAQKVGKATPSKTTDIKTPPVIVRPTLIPKPNRGELYVAAIPGATVTMTKSPTAKSAPTPIGAITFRGVVSDQATLKFTDVQPGRYTLSIHHPDYPPRSETVDIAAGRITALAVELEPSTVTLNLRSRPGARLYLDDEEKGTLLPDGTIRVVKLQPGVYRLRVSLDGYEEAEKSLVLTLAERSHEERVELVPISSESALETFALGVKNWTASDDWRFDRNGIYVRGDKVGLFKGPQEKRPFNTYRDFMLRFDLRLANGKGASWVFRAEDANNYYLCELTTPESKGGRKALNFYVCRDGKCFLRDSRPVVEDIEKPGDSFHILVQARGNRFTISMSVASNPRVDDPQPLAVIEDDTFAYGGVGFRSINGQEMLIQSLVVEPLTRSGN